MLKIGQGLDGVQPELSGLKVSSRLISCPFSAPSFLRELCDETVVLGQSVTLACQVLAQPAAQATWSKGKELSWSGGENGGQQEVVAVQERN